VQSVAVRRIQDRSADLSFIGECDRDGNFIELSKYAAAEGD
jgi:hypothetical protein